MELNTVIINIIFTENLNILYVWQHPPSCKMYICTGKAVLRQCFIKYLCRSNCQVYSLCAEIFLKGLGHDKNIIYYKVSKQNN